MSQEKKGEALMHIEEIVESLFDMTYQHCYCEEDGRLDSMALSSCSDSLRLLGRLGMVTIESDVGRRVIARVKEEGSDGSGN